MKNHMGPVSVPLVFASLFVLLTLTVVLSHPASAQLAAPNHLRVDISDGTTGQLFVSWDQVSTATYYELQRSTSPSSGYADVPNCSVLADANSLQTPWVSKICRDNNGGNPTLTPGTTYYYQVRACNSTPCTGTYTSTTPSNIPVTCNNCTSQIPPMCSGSPRTCLHAPPRLPACNPPTLPPACVYPTSTITPGAMYKKTAYEAVAYPTSGTNYQGKLVVDLPGSDESSGRPAWLYTAQNLGFDVISVDYDSRYEQEVICQTSASITTAAQAAACFTNITQAKLNFTGPCIPVANGGSPNNTNCGTVPDGSGGPYIIPVAQDDVVVRVSTMLQYLWCHGYDSPPSSPNTKWENYLATGTTCATTNPQPNWSKITLGGHSQGGDMATFAADKYPINRAINLSAPPQATSVSGTETAASYFADFATGVSMTSIRSIYGLVSENDTTRYNSNPGLGVYQAVWQAIGYNIPANNDAEWELNEAGSLQPLVCSSTASHNFSTDAAQSPGGGHSDPTYIWNEDIFEYMLNNQL